MTCNAPVVDASGNVAVVDSGKVRLITPTGTVSTLGGTSASTLFPSALDPALASDISGNYYVSTGSTIKSVSGTSPSTAKVIVGTLNTPGSSGDGGAATSAKLVTASGLVIDSAAGKLYISQSGTYTIRVVSGLTVTNGVPSFTGTITTFAGQSGICLTFPSVGTPGCLQDFTKLGDGGAATSAVFGSTGALALDASGNLYVVDTTLRRIR